jgi:hypothetical protein
MLLFSLLQCTNYWGAKLELSNDKFRVKTSYLCKRKDNTKDVNLYSISANTSLGKGIKVEAEISLGEHNHCYGQAYLLKSYYSSVNANASLIYLSANEAFFGFYQNTKYLLGNINYALSKKFHLGVMFKKDEVNAKRDTIYGKAPYSESMKVRLKYSYSKAGRINLQVGIQTKEDRLEKKSFDYKKEFLRLFVSQDISSLQLEVDAELANARNRLNKEEGLSWSSEIHCSYPFLKGSMALFSSYEETSLYGKDQEKQFLYGLNLLTKVGAKSDLSLSYKSNYSIEEYYRNRSLLDLMWVQRLSNNHKLELNFNHSLLRHSTSDKGIYASLKYTALINVPIKKTLDYGFLEGEIKNDGVKGVKGIRLYLGGNIAITDAEGRFKFVNIKPEKYYLLLDRSSLGIYDIPTVTVPIEVDIKSGVNRIQFGLTKQARLLGSFSIINKIKLNNSNMKKKHKVIVEIFNEKVKYHKIVDIEKPFEFNNLILDTYTVNFRMGAKKSDYIFLKNKMLFKLSAGEEFTFVVDLKRKKKNIKFQEEVLELSFNKFKIR